MQVKVQVLVVAARVSHAYHLIQIVSNVQRAICQIKTPKAACPLWNKIGFSDTLHLN